MVWMNDHMFSDGACSCSWGGVKRSGLGRSHSKFGLYECVNVKLVTGSRRARATPVAPVRRGAGKAMQARLGSCTGATPTSPTRCAAPRRRFRLARKSLRDLFRR